MLYSRSHAKFPPPHTRLEDWNAHGDGVWGWRWLPGRGKNSPPEHPASEKLKDRNLLMNGSETELIHPSNNVSLRSHKQTVTKGYTAAVKRGEIARSCVPFFAALQTFNHAAPSAISRSINPLWKFCIRRTERNPLAPKLQCLLCMIHHNYIVIAAMVSHPSKS